MRTAAELAAMLAEATGKPWELPAHVFQRLHALVANEMVRYIDGDVSPSGRAYTGTIVAFTDTRVLRADLKEAGRPDPNRRAVASVAVTSWARASLTCIALEPEEDRWRNTDDVWSGNSGPQWPAGAAATMEYPGREPLRLPMMENPPAVLRESFGEFIASLVADLALPGVCNHARIDADRS